MSAQERARLNSIYTRAEGGIARALPIRAAAQGGPPAGGAAYAVPPFSAEFALPRIPARRIRARSASDRMAGSFPAGAA